MSTLYVEEQGAVVGHHGERFYADKGGRLELLENVGTDRHNQIHHTALSWRRIVPRALLAELAMTKPERPRL